VKRKGGEEEKRREEKRREEKRREEKRREEKRRERREGKLRLAMSTRGVGKGMGKGEQEQEKSKRACVFSLYQCTRKPSKHTEIS
jgi:hypothetical protein